MTVHSIRFKTTAVAIAEILTAILCVFLASLSIARAENDRRSVEVMDLIAQDTRQSLEKYTEGIQQSVEVIANLSGDTLDSVSLVQDGVGGASAAEARRTPEQTARLDAYLADHCRSIQLDFATVADHTRGAFAYYYCISPDISATEHGFLYSRVGRTGFDEQAPIDAATLDPNDMEHNAWYFTAVQRGLPTWIGPYASPVLGGTTICSYVVPIYKAGSLIGVLGMDIPLETLTSLVSSISVYQTGFASLLDAEGHVLYHPALESDTVLELPIGEDVLQQKDSGGMLIRYTREGQMRQMSFTTLSNGMKLAIVAPTAEVDASLIRLTRTVLLITVVIVSLFAVLTLFLMGLLTRPLQRLTAASQRLALADYDVELDYKGKDEVGALTASFQRMRDQLKSYIDDLNRKVLTDDLTGLPNQRHFFALALAERDRLLAEGKEPVMLYFNLVGMKHFNRQHGFDEGDKLIREVAKILSRRFGELNTSRFGQDHFAVVTSEDNLVKRFDEVFYDCLNANGGKTLPVSAGIYRNSMGDVNVGVACDRAKFACDRRRGTYYSGYRFFDEEMLRQIDLFRHVISHLDQAFDEQWIQVYYQPIVRAVNGQVCEEEALSRWFDPEKGFLPPADFIPALEGAGLIYRLDLYVLDQTLAKIKRQTAEGQLAASHSINLSRSDFDSLDMVEEIRRRVDAARVPRDRITIEITESIIGSDFDFMKEQVERFQQLGFPVWMDDFGSGYSSLDMLQNIRFDLLKFDMSFLGKLAESDRSKVILTELIQMATALGVDTLCEGVETESQVRFLREVGCSKLQGFYFGQPEPFGQGAERAHWGAALGYENPAESDYYEAIGRLNLHDLAAIINEDEDPVKNVFNDLPMAVMEIKGNVAWFVRTNQSFRDFLRRHFAWLVENASSGIIDLSDEDEATFIGYVHECQEDGSRVFFAQRMPDGSTGHFLVKRIRTNPVTGTLAAAIAVLSIDA